MNAPTAAWTIGQLATRVAEVLAAGVPGQVNGRVREVPDVRTLRWYTSIGLLDRPAAMRGRTGLYGRRHLVQVVAIKRLQGEGWSLAEIQERLIGADDAVLEEIAAMPGPGRTPPEVKKRDAGDAVSAVSAARRGRFWAAPGGAGPAAEDADADADRDSDTDTDTHSAVAPATEPTVTLSRSARAAHKPQPHPDRQHRHEPQLRTRTAAQPAVIADIAVISAIRLAPDVTLVLGTDAIPEDADLPALTEAARPLLDMLRRLGLAED